MAIKNKNYKIIGLFLVLAVMIISGIIFYLNSLVIKDFSKSKEAAYFAAAQCIAYEMVDEAEKLEASKQSSLTRNKSFTIVMDTDCAYFINIFYNFLIKDIQDSYGLEEINRKTKKLIKETVLNYLQNYTFDILNGDNKELIELHQKYYQDTNFSDEDMNKLADYYSENNKYDEIFIIVANILNIQRP